MSVRQITTTSNYVFLGKSYREALHGLKAYQKAKEEGREEEAERIDQERLKGVGLEGGSRSGKTYDACNFLCQYLNTFTGKTITIGRDSRVRLKDTLYQTLKKVWQNWGMPMSHFNKSMADIEFNGNKVIFIGINDDPMRAHGLESDLLWINEAMNVRKDAFDQLVQRTKEFYILDYNPSATKSWCYDLELQPDYRLHKTTLLDNPYIPANSRRKILSYEPTEDNVARGTADRFNWEVYGLGMRSKSEDVVFRSYETYQDEPDEWDWMINGGDFGLDDPSTLIKVKKNGNNIYLKELY